MFLNFLCPATRAEYGGDVFFEGRSLLGMLQIALSTKKIGHCFFQTYLHAKFKLWLYVAKWMISF